MNEVFYEFKETKLQSDLSSQFSIEIILHFLGKIESSIILYETTQTIKKTKDSDIDAQVIEALQNLIREVDETIILVKGKIREIFLSYSS
jgi:hypothetical protein